MHPYRLARPRRGRFLTTLLLIAACVMGQAAPSGFTPEQREKITKAVTQLVAEANQLDQIEEPKVKPVFDRPHPLLKSLGSDDMGLVVARTAGALTKNDYRDAYVRWHLMWVLKKATQEQRAEHGPVLLKVLEDIPGPLRVERQRTYERKNPELYAEWAKIYYGDLRVMTGYPPHEKPVYPPQSIALFPDSQKRRAEQLWVYAQRLEANGAKETETFPKAIAFNRRIDEVNTIARTYQGELVYFLVTSRDFNIVKAVVRQMDKHARQGSLVSIDMMNYMYQAAFDGYFDGFSPAELKELAGALEKTARATENVWVNQGWATRNFAHYSYHMIKSFEMGDSMAAVSKGS